MATGLRPPARKPNRGLLTAITVVVALAVFVPWLVGYYTDWLWFRHIEYDSVFVKTLVTRLILFLVFGLVAAGVTWLAGYMAFKYRPDELDGGDMSPTIHEYRKVIEKSLKRLLLGLPLIVGILGGLMGQAAWRTVLFFFNRQPFGVQDPQFHKDLGFYAFTLPVIQLIVGSLLVLLAVAFFIALVGHYLLGGLRPGNRAAGQTAFVSRPARVQLAVTAGLWMLLMVANYWLQRYTLLDNQYATFTGGNYTDINAQLPAKIILMVIGIVVAVAFFSAVVLKDMRIPAVATVLMVLSSLVVGTAWPAVVQQFKVKPNGQEAESPYIARNIEATRYAYGIGDDHVTYLDNWGADATSDEEVASDSSTVSNIRILDPEVLPDTFTQMQQLKNFYGFQNPLSIDRYEQDGEVRDYVVAAREMNPTALADNQKDWLNRHTVYTHGNGFVAAPANRVDEVARDASSTRGGYPVFTVADLSTVEKDTAAGHPDKLNLNLTQPRIYYGTVISKVPDIVDYAIVGSSNDQSWEYDTDTTMYTYDGKGGVPIGNYFNRIAYALQFQELSFLLSDRVGGESKILYNRDPRERVEKVAPWLTTDSKAYPAVIDGHIKWIVDGYTTLTNLPYSQRMSLTETTQDALNPTGTDQRLLYDQVSYIRNSVKAVVDAYDGSVTLYEFDEQDPVLKAWQKAFPGTVKPKNEIPEELNTHLRYPEDLFKVQRELIARYHVDDPGTFFKNEAFWSVPNDPSATEERKNLRQPPYYVVAADPETNDPTFQLITPFRGLEREFLSAHMTVTSDPENYGKITVRVLPTNSQTLGPKQAQDTMDSSDQVARDRSLWQNTNEVMNGNLLTLPVGGGKILYVEPMYTKRKGQQSAFPKLLRVLVSYDGKIGYAPTVAEALSQVGINPREASDLKEAGVSVDETEGNANKPADDQSGNAPASAAPGDAQAAIERINKALNGVRAARDGSHEEYGRALDELDRAVAEYQKNFQ